jgi:PD-(D/E)XK endonuclease
MPSSRMNLRHPKKRGEWAEMRFMVRAAEHGITVSKPWGDSSCYDFASEYDGNFYRVQVKSTSLKIYESYSCHVNTGDGARYVENQIDFLAAYIVPLDLWYIVPAGVAVNNHCVIILSPHLPTSKHARYREAWHLLKEQRRPSPHSLPTTVS